MEILTKNIAVYAKMDKNVGVFLRKTPMFQKSGENHRK
jgi:hypothetical protein